MRSIDAVRLTDQVIAIGASTGGTEAIAEVLRGLPADAPGLVIVQHIPPEFSRRFAARLDGDCALSVREAQDGDEVLVGHAYIAPGDRHLRIVRSGARWQCRLGSEPPVSGVTVNLYASNGTTFIASTSTDNSGFYSFIDLVPGTTYVVEFVAPAGDSFTSQFSGTAANDSNANPADGRATVIAPASGVNSVGSPDDPTIDAGVYQTAAIGDVAWEDTNADGLQTTGEIGIGGVSVLLTDSKGVAIATTVTAADGTYSFTGLEPGIYGICFAGLPAGYDFSGQDVGSDDTVDSDADTIDGCTVTTELTGGELYVDPKNLLDPPSIARLRKRAARFAHGRQ